MANYNTDAVTAIVGGNPEIVDKVSYRGNPQVIPVEFSTDGVYSADTLTFSAKLPPDCKVVGIALEHTAIASGVLDIGTADTTDSIIDGADMTSAGLITYPGTGTAGAGGPIDVSANSIVGAITGTMSTDSIKGTITIITNQ